MVVLLIAHHVNHLVDGVILEAHFSSTDILCHIDAGAIGTQQEFLVKALVSKIGPNRIVGLGFKWGKELVHFSYGMVELPNGKMKSREGTVVDADDLMALMVSDAKKTSEELGKFDDMSEDERNEIARRGRTG